MSQADIALDALADWALSIRRRFEVTVLRNSSGSERVPVTAAVGALTTPASSRQGQSCQVVASEFGG
jgi:hypothetical protein